MPFNGESSIIKIKNILIYGIYLIIALDFFIKKIKINKCLLNKTNRGTTDA